MSKFHAAQQGKEKPSKRNKKQMGCSFAGPKTFPGISTIAGTRLLTARHDSTDGKHGARSIMMNTA